MVSRKSITDAITSALADKGKRKFSQSMEMIMNFRGVDFTKPENRLNMDIILPKGRGKNVKVVVFGEGQVALEAKNAGADEVIDTAGIPKLKEAKGKLKELVKSAEFLAQPSLMITVGKNLGQVLGGKGKLPRPIADANVANAVKQARSRVRLSSKGKYLPVAQCAIGSETMVADDIAENFETVYDKVKARYMEFAIKSVFVKLSMGKPVKVEQK